jgi:hypothetical protein
VTRNRRLILSAVIALAWGVPALFEAPWMSPVLSPILFFGNMPGLLLAIPHVPPEGIPGQSAPQAVLMLLAQSGVWFTILTLLTRFMRRPQGNTPNT